MVQSSVRPQPRPGVVAMAEVPSKPWLAERIAAGRRKAHQDRCGKCGADVLAGLDDDVAALQVVVDSTPVDAVGELSAIADGAASYALIGDELSYRTLRWHVRHSPAGTVSYPVHTTHHCTSRGMSGS